MKKKYRITLDVNAGEYTSDLHVSGYDLYVEQKTDSVFVVYVANSRNIVFEYDERVLSVERVDEVI